MTTDCDEVRLAARETQAEDDRTGRRRSADWDVRSGPRNYLGLVGAQAIGSALACAALWLATRVLGPAGYGGVAAIMAASQLASQLAVQWSAVSVVRFGCQEFIETGRAATAFWARSAILVPNLIVLVAASRWWLPPVCASLHLPSEAHRLVLSHLVTTAVWIHVQQALQAVKLPRLQGGLLAAERGLLFLGLAGLAETGGATPITVMWAYVLAPVIVSAVGLWQLRSLVCFRSRLDGSLLRRMAWFSLPLIPYSLAGYLSTSYLDAFFISHYLSSADLGRYSLAYQLAGTVMQLPVIAGSLLLPYFITLQATGRDGQVLRYMRDALPLAALLWSAVCVLGAGLGSLLVPILFGHQFRAAAALLWPLMAAAALAGPGCMGYAPVTNARSMTYIAAMASLASAITNVALDGLMIPHYGLVGCAWATVGAYGVSLLTMAWHVHRRVPSSRNWAVLATTPAVIGAGFATWRADSTGALLIAILLSVILMFAQRKTILSGIQALSSAGNVHPLLRRYLTA
jgi:O-antigen/teichoic acid export membrane protein